MARADAFKTLWKIVSDHSNFEPPKSKTGAPMPGLTPVDDKKKFEAATRTLVQSLLHEPGFTQLYSAHWDNSDDTSFDGLIAINPTTGQIRTISVDMPA